MNVHEIILNMKNDKIIFKFDRCFHFEIFKTLKVKNERSIFFRKIYLFSSISSIKTSISMNFQKYQIIQRRSKSIASQIKFSFSIVENFENKKKFFIRNTLNFNSRYVIEKIDKRYFFAKFFKKKRRIKIIRNSQQFTIMKISIRKQSLIKKSTRKSFKQQKFDVMKSDVMKSNTIFDEFLNIIFIEVVAFQILANIKNKNKKIKTFYLIMKQLNEIIDKTKKDLSKIEFDFNFDFKEILIIMKAIINELKRKIFDFLKRFENVLNLKKTKNLIFHKFFDHKIELIDDLTQLSRNRVYSLFSKKFEIFKKHFHENLQKDFINSNKTFYISSILFAIKFNNQFKMCVNYRKLNVMIKRNSYFISLIEKTLIKIIDCKFISKLNIISTFNKFRMNFQNEKFITFICFLNIYQYHVLSFELTNDFVN